jgi:hypothetical protein
MSLGAQQRPQPISRAAVGLAVPLLAVAFAPARADTCDKLTAVRDQVELFDKVAAEKAVARIAKSELPRDLCGIATNNGRYRIMWKGRQHWVLASQFSSAPNVWEPIRPPQEQGPAGVRLGDAQLPPTGVGDRDAGVAWVVILEGDASVTLTISGRFGKVSVDFDPPATVESGGKV